MDTKAIKIELLKRIVLSKDQALLTSALKLFPSQPEDFWDELTEFQRREIDLALQQIESGETIPFEDFLKSRE